MRIFGLLFFIAMLSGTALGQQSSDVSSCGVDVRWLNTNGTVNYVRSSETPAQLSFLVHLSKGTNCSNAEVSVSATYLTESQDYVCSGTIRSAMTVTSNVQEFNISIRPFMQLDFLRWRNQPGARGEQPGQRLNCSNIDGTSDIGDAERHKAGWMRLTIGAAHSGGLSITEAIFRFQ
jgi:hypothetical protein